MSVFISVLQDALFAAIASIGFAAISQPPRAALLYCGLIAAVGHASRFLLMWPDTFGLHIVPATFIASFIIGCLAVFLSPLSRFPAETCLFPALLPMIPGIYAYKAIAGLGLCLFGTDQEAFDHYFYLFGYNAVVCAFILLSMAVGSLLPIFLFKNISFRATRDN